MKPKGEHQTHQPPGQMLVGDWRKELSDEARLDVCPKCGMSNGRHAKMCGRTALPGEK